MSISILKTNKTQKRNDLTHNKSSAEVIANKLELKLKQLSVRKPVNVESTFFNPDGLPRCVINPQCDSRAIEDYLKDKPAKRVRTK